MMTTGSMTVNTMSTVFYQALIDKNSQYENLCTARARRMRIAMKQIRSGKKLIDIQFDAGYESNSGFTDAFVKIMGTAPTKCHQQVLKAHWLDTPLGPMLAIADDHALYLLEFVDRRGLEREIEKLRKNFVIVPDKNDIIMMIAQELKAYFAGTLQKFKTPIHLIGTIFQQSVWQALLQVSYGTTRSYRQQATMIGKSSSYRAVANANGANQLAIIVPCHRIINSDGNLGGYGGRVDRKKWLIAHEQQSARG